MTANAPIAIQPQGAALDLLEPVPPRELEPVDAGLAAAQLVELRNASGLVNSLYHALSDGKIGNRKLGTDFTDWIFRVVWHYSAWRLAGVGAMASAEADDDGEIPEPLALRAACGLFKRRPAVLTRLECHVVADTFGVEVKRQLKCCRGSEAMCLNRTPLTAFRRDGGALNWYPIVSIDRLWSVREIRPVYRVRSDEVTCWRCADGEF